jgi:hypothetical protein
MQVRITVTPISDAGVELAPGTWSFSQDELSEPEIATAIPRLLAGWMRLAARIDEGTLPPLGPARARTSGGARSTRRKRDAD